MNKIYEFAANAALDDYINMDLNEKTGSEKLRIAEKKFNEFFNLVNMEEDKKNDFEDVVWFLVTEYENTAFIMGFCMAAELAYDSHN